MATWNRLDIYQRDGFRCLYCGFDGTTFDGWRYLTVDHIDPLGPRHEPDNLATCCRYCNECKGNGPCESIGQAREILKRHDADNRTYWEASVKPRIDGPLDAGRRRRLR